MPLHKSSRAITAFASCYGLYEFTTLPQGLRSSPQVFQGVVDKIIRGTERTFCSAYIDDLIISSSTLEDHIEHLDFILSRVRSSGIKLKKTKCEFFQISMTSILLTATVRKITMMYYLSFFIRITIHYYFVIFS